jgi:hypothetical protein
MGQNKEYNDPLKSNVVNSIPRPILRTMAAKPKNID